MTRPRKKGTDGVSKAECGVTKAIFVQFSAKPQGTADRKALEYLAKHYKLPMARVIVCLIREARARLRAT